MSNAMPVAALPFRKVDCAIFSALPEELVFIEAAFAEQPYEKWPLHSFVL